MVAIPADRRRNARRRYRLETAWFPGAKICEHQPSLLFRLGSANHPRHIEWFVDELNLYVIVVFHFFIVQIWCKVTNGRH